MSTIENKRLIATFMNYAGGRPLTDGLLLNLYNDWNSLMPVIEKCLIYCHENMLNEWENGFSDSFLSVNFNVLFKITTQFIQFHNEQQKVVQNDSKRN